MKITIERTIDIDIQKLYAFVKESYNKWIEYNIHFNLDPLHQSFDYNEEVELVEMFLASPEYALYQIGSIPGNITLNETEAKEIGNELSKYIKTRK